MSTKVDVLAVLDRAIEGDCIDIEVELMRVRAVVAALIDELARAEKKLTYLHAHYSGVEANGINLVVRGARAALARAGGAA